MQPRIQETATTGPIVDDYRKALKTQQKEWTAESLGLELEEAPPSTRADFEKTLRKISRRIKK